MRTIPSDRVKVLTVKITDCDVQHFRAGGKGGQNQNKRDTGARVIHRPSGARAESREHRTQLQNKRAAFVKMANSEDFRRWVQIQSGRQVVEVEEWVDEQMKPENLDVEYYTPS